MFDAHNHFTNVNSILCTSELLPQNIKEPINIEAIKESEIGLDKRFINIQSEEKQLQYLCSFLSYAVETNTPFTIHCVRFTEKMIDLLKKFKPEKGTAIWHSFNGSIETAQILKDMGILISVGPKYIKDISTLYKIDNNLLLETDYEGQSETEHNTIIFNQYKKLSETVNIPVEVLERNCKNAAMAFKDRIITW